MLRVAASRVLPLALRLREGGLLFSGWGRLITGGLINDTTLGHGQGMGLGMMSFYIILCIIHITQGQGQGTIVSYCATPVHCPCFIPSHVQCV